MNLQGKMVLVLGMGETGLSMVKWLSRQDAKVRVADSRMEPPNWKEIMQAFPQVQVYTGKFETKIFDDIEMIAISPGVPLADLCVQQHQNKRNNPESDDHLIFFPAFQFIVMMQWRHAKDTLSQQLK